MDSQAQLQLDESIIAYLVGDMDAHALKEFEELLSASEAARHRFAELSVQEVNLHQTLSLIQSSQLFSDGNAATTSDALKIVAKSASAESRRRKFSQRRRALSRRADSNVFVHPLAIAGMAALVLIGVFLFEGRENGLPIRTVVIQPKPPQPDPRYAIRHDLAQHEQTARRELEKREAGQPLAQEQLAQVKKEQLPALQPDNRTALEEMQKREREAEDEFAREASAVDVTQNDARDNNEERQTTEPKTSPPPEIVGEVAFVADANTSAAQVLVRGDDRKVRRMPLSKGLTIRVGDQIETAKAEKAARASEDRPLHATLDLYGVRLNLADETRVLVVANDKLDMSKGQIYADAADFGSYKKNLAIRTPAARIETSGSRFELRCESGQTFLSVASGNVTFANKFGEQNLIAQRTSVAGIGCAPSAPSGVVNGTIWTNGKPNAVTGGAASKAVAGGVANVANRVLAEFLAPAEVLAAAACAYDGSVLWISTTSKPMLYGLDPTTGRLQRTIDLNGIVRLPVGLAWDGSQLWVGDMIARAVCAIDIATGKPIKTIQLNFTPGASMASDRSNLYVSQSISDNAMAFCKIDTTDGHILATLTTPANSLQKLGPGVFVWGLAYVDGVMWRAATNNKSSVLMTLETDGGVKDGSVMDMFQMPDDAPIRNITTDGKGNLWVLISSNPRKLILIPKPQK